MALGKAFIEVHADTKPFARELGAELNKILKAAEADVKKSARNVGSTIAKETGKGFENEKKSVGRSIKRTFDDVGQDKGIFINFTKSIIDSIDDGLSGLPAEVKAGLGALLVGIAPFLAAGISGALSAAIAGAFAGLGVLVGSQFLEVQSRFQTFVDHLRFLFVRLGVDLVDPILRAMTMIENGLGDLQGQFAEVFSASAALIEPLTEAFLQFITYLLPGLIDSIRNSRGIVDALADGFRVLGATVGQSLDLITDTRYAADGLRDLLFVLSALIAATALLVRGLTEIYGRLRDVSLLITGPGGLAQFFSNVGVGAYNEQIQTAAERTGEFSGAIGRAIAPTEAEQKAIKDLNTQLDALSKLMFDQVNDEIAWEQAIDDFTASVRENGNTLKLSEQAGRNNAKALVELAQVAIKTRADQIALTGDVGAAEAAFQKQKSTIYALAAQMKLSKTETDRLIGALLNIPPPVASGVDSNTLVRLKAAIAAAQTLSSKLSTIQRLGAVAAAAAPYIYEASKNAHADGGVFSTPHMGLVAEAGPEAIIPLNNPGRAAEVMNEAGLSGMVSPTVNVYIGNQQIDAYIDTRVRQSMNTTARGLAYGARGI